MSANGWIVLGVVIVAAIILLFAWMGLRRRRLQSRFGPEYQRVATESGSKWRADSELAARQQHRQKLNIRPLPPESRRRYADSWQRVQAQFVDEPYPAVAAADQLVLSVMQERGYPMQDFEQHAADLSVDYPQLVENYRKAHVVATRQRSASTEDLRTAMLHYRALFEELLGGETTGEQRQAQRQDARQEQPAMQEGRG